MVVVCDFCREVVSVYDGYIMLHGSTYHGQFFPCAGSNVKYLTTPVQDHLE